jgi:uncharacterized membrane protein YgaE (UPF0421/DUF939 family)
LHRRLRQSLSMTTAVALGAAAAEVSVLSQ